MTFCLLAIFKCITIVLDIKQLTTFLTKLLITYISLFFKTLLMWVSINRSQHTEIKDSFLFLILIFRIFYVIDKLHKNKKTYVYEEKAQEAAMAYYNEQQLYLRENHNNDTYTSGKYS